MLATLPAKAEPHLGPDHIDLAVSQGRQPKGAVLFSVLVVAHPDPGFFQQPHHGGQHLWTGQSRQLQVTIGLGADSGERLSEGEHPVVLHRVSNFAPANVIAVLLPAARVRTGGLQMALRIRTDPDVASGRRDGQAFDPPRAWLPAWRAVRG